MLLDIKSILEKNKSIAIIRLNGRLDANTAPLLDAEAEKMMTPDINFIVLDMKHLDYISSAGIRSLLKMAKTMKTRGGKVGALSRQPQIIKVFEILQALPELKIFSNDEEMDQYLDSVQKKVCDGENP